MGKILLLYTSHRQLEEIYLQSLLYQKFPDNYSVITKLDTLFYCNSSEIDEEKLVKYINMLPQKNKKLIHTDKNIGYLWGGHEAVSETFDIWKEYDVVIHLHPDVFILNDQMITKLLEKLILTTEIDFISTYNLDPTKDDNKNYLSFDFFMFKPKQIFQKNNNNFFNLYLDEQERNNNKTPEHLLSRIIKKII